MQYIYIIICLCLSRILLAGTIDPAIPDAEYIEYGKKYACVLPIMGKIDDSNKSIFKASCVVIDEYNVITAAHILQNSFEQYVIVNEQKFECSVVAIHADFDDNKIGFNDIAMARISKPIKLAYYPKLYTDKDEKGKICGLAGYGFTGNFITGFKYENYDNQKRAGSNIIDDIENNTLIFSVNKGLKTKLEFLIAPGDSGGGLFIDQKLAGIHSYIYATDGKTDSNYSDIGCSTRVSDYIEWIEKTRIILKTQME